MQGIQQITKEISKRNKLNQEQIKQVLEDFLAVIKQEVVHGESISFKNYFTLKRSTTQPKGAKNCAKHEKALNDYKQANQGKGLTFFAKSAKFKSLVTETRNCRDCQSKKQALLKTVKPTNRISFKPSKEFWVNKRVKK